jgi:phosphatidylglycerol lysyltransferase
MRDTRFLRNLGPVIALVLLAAAVWVLDRELRHYHVHDILAAAGQIPLARIRWAVGLTVLGYVALSGYDLLGFAYIRQRLSYPRVALASFLAYAFSHNLGFGVVTGSAVRYRVYSGWGLGPVDVARVVALCGVTFWLGFLALCGMAFALGPLALPTRAPIGVGAVRVLGLVFLVLLALYLVWSIRGKTLRLRGWEFPTPPLWLSLAQIGISCVDWISVAAVLYVLLPAGVPAFPTYLALFLLAQVVGLASSVPGGLGVFEGTLLLLLPDQVPVPALIGALIVYRAVYYLLPLVIALVLMGANELARRRISLRRLTAFLEGSAGPIVPQVFAVTTFIAGTILLFSGATPTAHGRLTWLRNLLPLPVIEVSHFLGSLTGATLLLLARGIQRRIDAAYSITVALLVLGICASLLKGLDYEEAIVLALMLVTLLPCRRHFYRRAALLQEPFTAGWIVAIVTVVLSSVWLGFFSYKHVDYTRDLWWHFSFAGDASRFLRASVGAAAAVLLFAVARLLRPARPEPARPTDADLQRAESIIAQVPGTMGNFALLGDKHLLFNDPGTAFVMYGVQGRSWVALGEPVGPAVEHRELTWRFYELCDRHGGWAVVHQATTASLPMYVELGLTPVKIGENARVPLPSFTLEGRNRKQFRQVEHKFEHEGCTFEVVPAERVSTLLPQLRTISDAWLTDKHTREKRFAIGFFDERYLERYPVAIVRRGEQPLAFANIWCGAEKEELSIDLMRYVPGTPPGVMDLLFSQLMRWGQATGYRWFDLGMAPLAGLESHPLAPVWNRIGNLIFRHGEYFFNYQGLREYKDKFDPVWEPRYLVYPGGLILPNILLDLATLISGGVAGILRR